MIRPFPLHWACKRDLGVLSPPTAPSTRLSNHGTKKLRDAWTHRKLLHVSLYCLALDVKVHHAARNIVPPVLHVQMSVEDRCFRVGAFHGAYYEGQRVYLDAFKGWFMRASFGIQGVKIWRAWTDFATQLTL